MGTLYLQNRVSSVKKVPKRTPRKIIKFRKGAPSVVLRSIGKSVSVFSHGGDATRRWERGGEEKACGTFAGHGPDKL
jgi:hypothetical protein